jgi:PEP-CTERM motif
VNTSLITGLNGPLGLAISGGDLFVGNYSSGTIGEYNLNGTPVNASLITGLSNPNGMGISGGDLFVVNQSGTIGEYNLNGTPVNASLITGLSNPTGIGISGGYLFVSTESGTIGEYTTSGTTVNASLITIPTGIDAEMAVDGSELFVNNRNGGAGGGSVAEYTLGATPGTVASSDTSFITGLYEPNGIAVVPTPEPATLALASLGGLGVLLLRRKR